MKVILVATDYSKEAENAMEYAGAAAQVVGAKIVLFHLYKMSIHAMNSRLGPSSFEDLYNKSRKKLQETANSLAEKYKIEVLTDWRREDFYEEIVQSIQNYEVDIVVLGMASKSMEQDLLGNTTTAAIHKLKHPVLAIPYGVTFKGIKNILFAVDVVRGVHKEIFNRVKQVATDFGAKNVEVFHVGKKVEELETKGVDLEANHDYGEGHDGTKYFYKNIESNAVIEEIQKEIKEIEADILIMVPNRYGFWGSLVHRSKTRIMASGLEIPLLSLSI